MKFLPPLNSARLIQRYKRFLADITLNDGTDTTIHVANTGAMSGCGSTGDKIWYSTSDNPKRKLPKSWELTERDGHFICVNTIRANQVIELALQNKMIPELSEYSDIKREVKYGQENSKIDFLLTQPEKPDAYLEVKSVTLLENDQGYFPDAVSVRGQKHLRELITLKKDGKRAVLLFCILHSGIESVLPAEHIDPDYAALLKQAEKNGVEILTFKPDLQANLQ